MAILKSLVSAVSTYSKVPMPNLHYKEGEGRFTLCFFPFIGAIIAALLYLWFLLCWYCSIYETAEIIGFLLIPVAVTGGIHLDGFMDSMDAIHSYGTMEKKLEILKDPHIGAFCVIKLFELTAVWLIAVNVVMSQWYPVIFLGFIFSRVFSGLAISTFPLAKKDGMVFYTRSHMSKACPIVLVVEGLLLSAYMVYEYGYSTLILVVIMLLSFIYYLFKCNKDFGGITGDTSGCFLVMSETAWVVGLAVINMWWMRR